MIISVIGGSVCTAEETRLAETVGRELARRGATVVCGGLGGVMEAVCRGAREAGGHTIGLLPGNDPAAANRWVEFPIPTGLGFTRNAMVAQAGRAVIAIAGSYGTLSEMAFALIGGVPLIGVGTWEFAIEGEPDRRVIRAAGALDAVEKALAAAAARTAS